MFRVEIELAAATQFAITSPVVTWEEESVLGANPDLAPVMLGYSYNAPASAAHAWSLFLAPATGSAAELRIPVEAPPAVLGTFFSSLCGEDGIVIPRLWGMQSSAQPPNPAADFVPNLDPYLLFFETTGKTADGVLTVWYQHRSMGR